MSGIEVAGLAFGVLPILVEALKSYSIVTDKVHTVRHYSKEIKTVALQLRVQNVVFSNEIRLLLRSVEDERAVESMLDDTMHPRWTSQEMDSKLKTILQDSFALCRNIVEETKVTVDELRDELSKFDVLLSRKTKDESIKSVINRLRGAFKISYEKSTYLRCLANLRERNGDLSLLRSQMGALQQLDSRRVETGVQHVALPTTYKSIQTASRKLHEALCDAWRCDDAAHKQHYAKLCLEAEAHKDVKLDMVISCQDSPPNHHKKAPPQPPIWLYVQSMSNDNGCRNDNKAEDVLIRLQSSSLNPVSSSLKTNQVKKKASANFAEETRSRKKAKRVQFEDSPSQQTSATPGTDIIAPPILQGVNLYHMPNMCDYIHRKFLTLKTGSVSQCVGYLESPQLYKHIFYLQETDRMINSKAVSTQPTLVCSISDILAVDVEDVFDVVDQLKLAHKAAVAVLQYNETPWLSSRWRLQDLSYFGSKDSLDETALRTLHLSSQILKPNKTDLTVSMDGVETSSSRVSEAVRYGINNVTLFFLGVALLEIAHWAPIEKKMTAQDELNQVYAARRLAKGRAPLGPQYQKIAEKCLQCNFGFGTELNSSGLQTAVYNDVVCELEGMIEKLSV